MDGLIRRNHITGDEVRKRDGRDIEPLGPGIVVFRGIFIDSVSGISHHDEEGVTAIAQGDLDRAELSEITFGGC